MANSNISITESIPSWYYGDRHSHRLRLKLPYADKETSSCIGKEYDFILGGHADEEINNFNRLEFFSDGQMLENIWVSILYPHQFKLNNEEKSDYVKNIALVCANCNFWWCLIQTESGKFYRLPIDYEGYTNYTTQYFGDQQCQLSFTDWPNNDSPADIKDFVHQFGINSTDHNYICKHTEYAKLSDLSLIQFKSDNSS